MIGRTLIVTATVTAALTACSGGGETNQAANAVAAEPDGLAVNALAANESLVEPEIAVEPANLASPENVTVAPGEPTPPAPPKAPPSPPKAAPKAKAPDRADPPPPLPEEDPHAGHDMNNMSE